MAIQSHNKIINYELEGLSFQLFSVKEDLMKLSRELARQLADLHNTMATISTTGDNTVKMAACLVGMRNILSQAEIVSADAEEQDDTQ